MFKRFIFYFAFMIVLSAILISIRHQTGNLMIVETARTELTHFAKPGILLVPLDSRPPCTQFVAQLAAIGGKPVLMPPSEYLDHYKTPAKQKQVREWFLEHAKSSDTAIVSVDMLIHGGLLASRLSAGSEVDAQAVVDLLRKVKQDNPALKLYVFSIIPRLLLADTDEYYTHQKNVFNYSVRKDLLLTFENPIDYFKLRELEAQIPSLVIERYNSLYIKNKQFSYTLIGLAQEGIIDGLVIGQDDGHPFGLPNMAKAAIEHRIEQAQLRDKVFVTRGTDEVAVTLLGRIIAKTKNYKPKIHVRYTHPQAPSIVMPFMPHSVETTVKEKIRLVGGIRTATAEQADYILYIHIGTRSLKADVYSNAAGEIRDLLNSKHRVAVIDLTEDYYASQTLLPSLLSHDVPILSLSAYAGWNTTSNSIGTVLAQLAILGANPTSHLPIDLSLAVWTANTEFLVSRILDDWYFQKQIQPQINSDLIKSGLNPYNLNGFHKEASMIVQSKIKTSAQQLFSRYLSQKPLVVDTLDRPVEVIVTDLTTKAELPWERTFEVKLNPQLDIRYIK